MSENIIMPKLGMTMKEGTVEEWFKSEGDTVEEGESIVTISSEKLTNDVEAPASGTLLKIKVQAGEDAKVKAVLGIIGEEGEDVGSDDDDSEETTQENKDNDTTSEDQQASSNEEQSDKKDTEKEAKPEQRERIFISPLARSMAKDKDLDITRIKGTGGNDRITKLDIQRVDSEGYDYEGEAGTSNESASSTAQNVDVSSIGEGLNPMRQRIAQNMRQSLYNTAQLTLHRKVNADRLLDFKARLSEELKDADQDVKLTVTALLAKAVVLALKEYGAMNARYENGELTEYDDVHLGIATSLEDGLMVPVIDNADTKSIGTLAKEIKTSAEAVREGNTGDVQLSDATFTITNMGASGIEYFTPILNLGETGILGVGALAKELVLEGDNVKQISRIPLSLTFDHQILDGAGAADFLKVLAKYIENPYLLML
ncbi:dihydrolipoamide acetyltransferase family protein [Staphylococcus hominis]|jgi:pyruvate dehydrogenase E2 component (dihydrolipoamide acetyltransferase)|uniref:dihydrolipoamide acetyltransferase family protein n=1 Tax=Staphylococcus hominis TaxID=1290 RepID=UPI00066C6F16|nr:dihydrolipoamide acetyltransferase family protein [Staphylococcus hominis]OFM60186.1 branched-chain alpha-keto acid dehydrogenase subunit E2 [Staphylococcus sp. HMSC062C01]MBC3066837.1 2-oxo acid dehydrogenase subunit E2 [Staphylococcus hominis]MBC3073314.1 2-oxo acid dehydrogenase subunit E2 [Staphylococcus hominis]MCI2862823.1 2-oxo acid dehydrogenase subunit E2 [Staphylococcus hominis]MCI2866887.1 2-oxo acid dehydrogenase subunit E2 [Staphylococcus hominis]